MERIVNKKKKVLLEEYQSYVMMGIAARLKRERCIELIDNSNEEPVLDVIKPHQPEILICDIDDGVQNDFSLLIAIKRTQRHDRITTIREGRRM
jgi:DNA-binding NarL/FixJ family response regulator